jgi:hypothetical protein
MTINIEKARPDMETRKFVFLLLAGLGAAFITGAAAMALLAHLAGRL